MTHDQLELHVEGKWSCTLYAGEPHPRSQVHCFQLAASASTVCSGQGVALDWRTGFLPVPWQARS